MDSTNKGLQDIYQSPPRQPSIVARLFPSPVFYTRFLGLVFYYSLQARRGRYGDAAWQQSSLAVLRALEAVGARVRIENLSSLRLVNGPCVIVANHMSTLETIILPGIIQPLKDVTFVVKRGIVEYPVFKHIMRSREPIVVDRTNPREDLLKVLDEGQRILSAGRSVIVFPQTTRSLKFDSSKFNSIGTKLARRADVPVIPVAIRSDAWGIGRTVKEFGPIDVGKPVTFVFGSPISVSGRGHEAHQAVVDFVRGHMHAWGIPTT